MSRPKSTKQPFPEEADDTDEIEILEIVGFDEDLEPAAADGGDDPDGDPDDEGYVLDLDEPADPSLAESAQLVRLRADFENFKKRVERENEATRRQAAARLVKHLLPVLDNFERAVAASPRSTEESTFHSGFVLIFKQLLEALRTEGLTAIDSLGQPFDPNLHEAVATDPNSDLPSNTIVEELQRGYQLHHRLLRPALVKVSMDPSGDQPPPEDEGS